MSFLHTTDILAALKTRLVGLRVDPTQPGSPVLFQRVGFFGANRLAQAMKSVFASEDRCCFLVPGGDTHSGRQDSATLVHSQRLTRVALLIADRAFDADRDDALVGGSQAVGILDLKDRVIDDLFATPFTTPGLAFTPGEGEPLVIEPADRPSNNLGRECWLQWLITYAGSAKANVPR